MTFCESLCRSLVSPCFLRVVAHASFLLRLSSPRVDGRQLFACSSLGGRLDCAHLWLLKTVLLCTFVLGLRLGACFQIRVKPSLTPGILSGSGHCQQ